MRMNAWVEETKQNIVAYSNDFKDDEANLEKIKLNVYEIFLKMFDIAYKKANNVKALEANYLGFHEKIPANWKTKKAQSEKADDLNYYIETIKLETEDKIKKLFLSVVDQHA